MPSAPDPVPSAPRRPPVPRVAGYSVDQRLGRGGYAAIWLAWRQGPMGFHLPVALKILAPKHQRHEASRRRFFAEARLLATLDHPNVVSVIDAGEHDGSSYYVMEYIRGTSLAGLLQTRGGALPIDAALFIGTRVGSALQAVHTARGPQDEPLDAIHRDVHPANIMVGAGGTVKLIDFGIAISTIGPRDTRINVIKGNPRYLSPEQAFGGDVDPRADIYSLALTVYEALTGRAPLAGPDAAAEIAIARQPRIPAPSRYRRDLDERLDRVILTALSVDPDERFPDMASFVRALHSCRLDRNAGGLPESLDAMLGSTGPTPPPSPPVASTRRLPAPESPKGELPLDYLANSAEDSDEDEPTRPMQSAL